MTDIVERLRVDGGSKIEWEAADEIERLRAALRAMADCVVEMEAYNDVPGAQNDPVWQGIRKRGAEALAKAREET